MVLQSKRFYMYHLVPGIDHSSYESECKFLELVQKCKWVEMFQKFIKFQMFPKLLRTLGI